MVHPNVAKAYKEADFEITERASDVNERNLFEAARIAKEPAKRKIIQIVRTKNAGEEYFYLPTSNAKWDNFKKRKTTNIIGFKKSFAGGEDPNTFYHCSIHKYARLLNVKNEVGIWQCSVCGSRYLESQLTDKKSRLQSKKSKSRKSITASLKSKKKV